MRKCLIKKNRLVVTVAMVIFTSSLFLVPEGVLAFSGEGSGTEEDPYQITDWHELNETRDNLTAHYELQNNLDNETNGYEEHASETANDGDGWEPIGETDTDDPTEPFEGTFDGQNHSISDLYINRPETTQVGLFGTVGHRDGAGGVIKDLDILGASVDGAGAHYREGTGILAGTVFGDSEIKNVHTSGSVKQSDSNFGAGGLIGVIRDDDNKMVINNSYSDAEVTVGDGDWIGGLIGYTMNSNNIIVSNSYATGNVSGDYATGGLIGGSGGITIKNSYATGNVTGDSATGGLAGGNDGEIINSYSTGNVEGNNNTGGITGYNRYGEVENAYSTGEVTGNTNTGGLIGLNENIVQNSYWNTETSGIGTSDGGDGKTTEEMTWEYDEYTYVDWDMADDGSEPWLSGDHDIVEDHEGNTGYPALSWEHYEAEEDFVIESFQIYDRKLSEEEVKTLSNRGSIGEAQELEIRLSPWGVNIQNSLWLRRGRHNLLIGNQGYHERTNISLKSI